MARYALQGDACLRFYFGGPRLSEDKGFDFAGLRREAVETALDRVLASPALRAALRPHGISDLRVQPKSRQKQTETTRPWKLSLVLPSGLTIFSKLEISRRDDLGDVPSGIPSPGILREHGLEPFVPRYHDAPGLARAKMRALAEPRRQACRGLFDLFHPIRHAGVVLGETVREFPRETLEAAREKVFAYDVVRFEAVIPRSSPGTLPGISLRATGRERTRSRRRARSRARGSGMTATRLLARLAGAGLRVFTTADAAHLSEAAPEAACQTLRRLSAEGLLAHLKRSVWASLLPEGLHPFEADPRFAAPWPAYVSLHSALRFRGMLGQVPRTVFAVTPGKSARFEAPLGSYSFHRIRAGLFEGSAWESVARGRFPLGEAERAILDALYLEWRGIRVARLLPELDPEGVLRPERLREFLPRANEPSLDAAARERRLVTSPRERPPRPARMRRDDPGRPARSRERSARR